MMCDDEDEGDGDDVTTTTMTRMATARQVTGYDDNGKDNGGRR